jgi:exoribonuclease-2
MLPPAATECLALGFEEVSPASLFALDVYEEGSALAAEIVLSRVRFSRSSYAEAEEQMDGGPLSRLNELAHLLQERRRQNGATEIDLPEVKIRVVDGRVVIKPLPRLRSREIVREAMLAAGQAVAQFAIEHEIPIPFTSQEPPQPVEELPEGPAGQFALRRTFRRSQASLAPGPHAGLGLPVYAQATSPLRRYLDLVVHQQLRARLKGAPLLDEQAITERVGAAEAVRGDVRYAERLANEHWTLVYLLQNPDWTGRAVVVEKYGQRSKLLIPELALETQMYLGRQPALNETVTLAVEEVNLAERTAHFHEVE